MKKDNYYNFSIFERICLILFHLLNVILFIYALQFMFSSGNIVISIICLLVCVIDIGYFLASRKMNEKHGYLMEIEEQYKEKK